MIWEGITEGDIGSSECKYYGYYAWLRSKILNDGIFGPDGSSHYNMMLGIMFRKEFYAIVDQDVNRGHDGIALREQYLYWVNDILKSAEALHGASDSVSIMEDPGLYQVPEDFRYTPNTRLFTCRERIEGVEIVPQGPCRVLEMIIGVVNRMVFKLDDGESGDIFKEIFWEIIANLGLIGHTDEAMTFEMEAQTYNRVDILLDRKYRRSGRGGMFPLKQSKNEKDLTQQIAKKDQREVEIAYQMDCYVSQRRRARKGVRV